MTDTAIPIRNQTSRPLIRTPDGAACRGAGDAAEVAAHADGREPVGTANSAIRGDRVVVVIGDAVKIGASR
jgi:hypothetical protein